MVANMQCMFRLNVGVIEDAGLKKRPLRVDVKCTDRNSQCKFDLCSDRSSWQQYKIEQKLKSYRSSCLKLKRHWLRTSYSDISLDMTMKSTLAAQLLTNTRNFWIFLSLKMETEQSNGCNCYNWTHSSATHEHFATDPKRKYLLRISGLHKQLYVHLGQTSLTSSQ